MDQAKTVIAQESTTGLSVKALSARLRVSPQLLTLRFRQFDKTTPHELILQTRLEKVKKLLANHAMKIDSIAAQCGFSSANRLSHLFKERFKVTMREYRAASTAVRR